MSSIEVYPNRFGRFIWRMLPVVLMPLVLLLLLFPLARHRRFHPLPDFFHNPDYLVCLHLAEGIYPSIPQSSEQAVPLLTRRLMRVTAYCPCRKCCVDSSDGITASGHKISRSDVFAAAPPSIPFGTLILIPGYNDDRPVFVLDRIGRSDVNSLDIFFPEHNKAIKWGKRELIVTIEAYPHVPAK